MDLNEILQNQAQLVMDSYSNFEEMKKLASSMKDVNQWDEYKLDEDYEDEESPEMELAETPEEELEEIEEGDGGEAEVSYNGMMASGYQDSIDQWKNYMNQHASGEWFENNPEEFPVSLCQESDEIDADDPKYAYGKPMGVPKSVWVHQKNANTQIPMSDKE